MNCKKIFCILFAVSLCLRCSAESKNEKADIFFEKASPSTESEEESLKQKQPALKTAKITVELAITEAQKNRGFMERKIIPEGTGMIFIYKEDEKVRFWMKNTPHPLSIAFIDSSGTIREIYDMTPYSLESTASSYFVRYALEVPQGMFGRMGIKEGDKLSKESLMLLKRKAVEKS
ncbi:DUF192 domain-containing protein [Treponema pedis]|uniref:Uncharacterized protein n=1 Tax=Treponema pedis str. T A4 TaxID=1291379 RepID=S5ZZJ9_9SPIR|nr:DUF192 domain-containing protein [Treponema pedis]AGT43713.1 hypothetical protein TPE_1218 [Treponema pedis str. T A4]